MNIREIIHLVESIETVPVLYHGTCESNAQNLIENGWTPGSGSQGGNMGQSRYLYLSTGYEDALWFAQEKGCESVVEVHNVPMAYLIVDPEDGSSDTLEGELNNSHGFPGKVALTRSLGAEHFKLSHRKQ